MWRPATEAALNRDQLVRIPAAQWQNHPGPGNFIGLPIQVPVNLAPGTSASALYSVRGLAQALAQSQDSGKRARPFVDTGHRKMLGKPTDLGDRIRSLIDHV